jgi:translation initiation factor IF-2
MTKIRVHELAKELNMDQKDLLDRIQKLGLPGVKNHMSSLSDAAVLKLRQQFAEPKAERERVEEKRIGREVIRRRKKVLEEEPVLPEAVVAPEAAEAAPAVAMEEVPSPEVEISEAPSVEAPFEAAPAPAQQPPAAPVAREEKPGPAAPRKPVREAARIVKLPEAPVAPPAATAVPAAPPPAAGTAPGLKDVQARRGDAKPAPTLEKPQSPAAPLEFKPASPRTGDVRQVTDEEEDDRGGRAKKAKKRRRKKSRKEEPARIIKLPELLAEEAEEDTEAAVLDIGAAEQPEATDTQEAQRKKRPAKPEETAPGAAARTAKGPRRKEVFEREALYSKKELAAFDGRGRGRGDRGRGALKEVPRPELAVAKVGKRRIKIDEAITVANLARQMGLKASEIIRKLLMLGLTANINQALDFDTAALVASDFEYEVEKTAFEEDDVLQVTEDRTEDLVPRPPVVTVMGHVDHGKTSLLDAIRDTDVIGGEAGGITQHIGAYHVKLEKGDIVFLDTPGHEAFTSMRARGAKVTDIVILVVAADDGVMQQTIEAINHSKAAEVPIIVAINKIDKPNANIDKVKRELSEQALIPEEWGGNTVMVEISAKKRTGIDDLLEMVLLQAELLELKANPAKLARGHVIEAKLDKGRGPVATVLVQHGTLKTGDFYLCGANSGRVRSMYDDRGRKIESAGPAMPVEVVGLSGVPNAGDDFVALADERQAKMVAEHRLMKMREKELSRTSKVTLESLFDQIQEGEVRELTVILKTDVHGSLEAISDSLVKLSTSEVRVNLIHTGTGAVTETDVMLASASNAIVVGFNVRSEPKVQELAEQESVDLRFYDVIYQLIDDVKAAMVGMLKPVFKENVMGRAEVRQTFHVSKIGTIAGCSVLDGHIERGARVRVLRDHVVVYDGKIGSLKRFKDDVKEVKSGFECGIGIENFNDVKEKDIFEAYEMLEIKAVLEPEPDRK